MPLTISQLLQDQLNKIPDSQLGIAILVQLRGNNNPTPEEIQKAMEDVEAGNTRPLGKEEREAAEKEAHRQKLLTELKRIYSIPSKDKTMDDYSLMRGVFSSLMLQFPEEVGRGTPEE